MDPKIVRSITEQIYRRFPEFAGCRPKVRQQMAGGAGGPLPKGGPTTYLLTFQSSASAAGLGRTIPRWVRVVVTEGGRILKVTTSLSLAARRTHA